MAIKRCSCLVCDKCGMIFDSGFGQVAKQFRTDAKDDGWVRIGKDDLCYDCKQEEG